jgi:hypothetical protein
MVEASANLAPHLPWSIDEPESPDGIIRPGGGLRNASVSVYIVASGGHFINCATVDPDNAIVESDESNNTDCVTIQIRP